MHTFMLAQMYIYTCMHKQSSMAVYIHTQISVCMHTVCLYTYRYIGKRVDDKCITNHWLTGTHRDTDIQYTYTCVTIKLSHV